MNKSAGTSILLQLLIFCALQQTKLRCLDLTVLNSKLNTMFYSNVDKNEGTTSFRSLNIPVGGRAESMGTAYTALADDISFFDYNPAASAVLKNSEAAVFHNAWISDSAVETVAATTRFGNLGTGVQLKCFYVPFTEYNSTGERTTGNYYSETTATLNVSYNFLAGYNFKGIAIGSNLKAAWRSVPDYTDNDTGAIISGSGLAQSGAAVMADLGLLFRFNAAKLYVDRDPNLQIGFSLLNAGNAWTGFGATVTRDDPLPTKVAAGISYRMIRPLTFTAEFRQPVNLSNITSSEQWSAGGGASVQITDFFTCMGGFLLQGANPRISFGSQFEVNKVQMNINYTFDLTTSMNPVNHISLSAKINLGDKGRQKLRDAVDNYYREGIAYYARGNLTAAIEQWKKALELNKYFDPAKEAIKTAERSMQLYRRIVDIQTLE